MCLVLGRQLRSWNRRFFTMTLLTFTRSVALVPSARRVLIAPRRKKLKEGFICRVFLWLFKSESLRKGFEFCCETTTSLRKPRFSFLQAHLKRLDFVFSEGKLREGPDLVGFLWVLRSWRPRSSGEGIEKTCPHFPRSRAPRFLVYKVNWSRVGPEAAISTSTRTNTTPEKPPHQASQIRQETFGSSAKGCQRISCATRPNIWTSALFSAGTAAGCSIHLCAPEPSFNLPWSM